MISRLTQSAKSGPIIVILMIVALYSKWVGYIAELSYYKHELTIRAGTLFFLVPMIWHSLWLLNKVRHRSRKVLLLIYILLFIVPNALSAWLYDVPVLFPALCWFCMFLVRKQFLLDNPEGAIKSEKKIAQIAIFFAFCLFSYFFAVHRFNINWGAIFFEDVYEWRFQVSGQRGWLETLIFSSGTKFLLPSVLSYCLYKGRKAYVHHDRACFDLLVFNVKPQIDFVLGLYSLFWSLLFTAWCHCVDCLGSDVVSFGF